MRQPVPRCPPMAPPQTLEDLRPLIVGPEQTRIEELERRLDQDLGSMVADVLPKAVVASRKQSDALAWAFEPLLDRSVREIVRKDPAGFADAISPAIGPAIRSAIARALQAMVQRFNEALSHSLSLRGLRWRVEAARSGRPYAEIVLLRTLVYRVEQLFLIHRDTGLLIGHQTAVDVPDQNPDQISAMLSALETFTREAFREDARLERFRVGELVGWVEHGPSAILAAIVRGTAPERYEVVLRAALERAHLEYGEALVDFRGDVAPLAGVGELLSDCLQEKHEAPRRWLTPRRAAIALFAVVASVGGLLIHASWRDQRRFARYVEALQNEPGLVVTGAVRHGGHYTITGLRDPLVADPASIWTRNGLDPERASARLDAFYSLDPRFAERRAEQILQPPPEVELTYQNGTLVARGTAPEAWINWVRSSARFLPAVATLDSTHLHSQESVARVEALAGALERTELPFPLGSDRLPVSQRARLAAAAADAKRLIELAPQIGMKARIEVVGYADASGTMARNQDISQARAEAVAAGLAAEGVTRDNLVIRGGKVRSDVLPPECLPPIDDARCDRAGGTERARSVALRAVLRSVEEEE